MQVQKIVSLVLNHSIFFKNAMVSLKIIMFIDN